MTGLPDPFAAPGCPHGLSARIWNRRAFCAQVGTLVSIGDTRRGVVQTVLNDESAMAATQSALRNGIAWRTIDADMGESWTFQIEEEAAAMLLKGQGEIDLTPLQADAAQGCVKTDRQDRAKTRLAAIPA